MPKKQESLEQSLEREIYDNYHAKQGLVWDDEFKWSGREK